MNFFTFLAYAPEVDVHTFQGKYLLDNPFESGHIKNYVLLYVSVVVIMVLFFIASMLLNDVEVFEKKMFASQVQTSHTKEQEIKEERQSRFKLLEKAY